MATYAAIAMAISTIAQGYATYKEGKEQKEIADANAKILEANADQKRLETSINEDQKRKENRQILARNIVAAGEQGMGQSATTLGYLGQQATTLDQNALNLRYEGLSAATRLDNEAMYSRFQGKVAKQQGKRAFQLSFLSGAAKGMSTYYSFGGTGGTGGTPSGGSNTVPAGQYYNIGGNMYYAQSIK